MRKILLLLALGFAIAPGVATVTIAPATAAFCNFMRPNCMSTQQGELTIVLERQQ